jgi:DNA-binding NarL/FixJ family response regulator
VLADARLIVESAGAPSELSANWRGNVIITDTFGSPYRTEAAIKVIRDLRLRFGAAVVVVSAHREVQEDGDRLDADAIVLKPFEVDTLLAAVHSAARTERGSSG